MYSNYRRAATAAMTVIALAFITACGSEPSGGGSQISYKDMKAMVIDILKTEDGQKAMQQASMQTAGSGGGIMMLSAQDKESVKVAVKDVLVSPDYNKVLEKLMTDPRFAGEFAKAVNKQNKQIHKDLLKDPTYQHDLMTVMKGPEMETVIFDVIQGNQYRKQVSTIMQETLQSPMVKLQLLDLLRTAVQEELRPKAGQKSGGAESGGGESGSSDSGGGDGGSSDGG
ncbi:spore gernimation protein [Paenibacillus darwinianus]|uniref:Spore gernimation protein n=1 Tax=Paenibacillus darwinianus TaxID=1380763 RepID=A0A9W5S155_9BACL|nr:spore germination lipoprotein GerD [Paenibacillus darwinianus]EXX88921.1 spore gernimation protein [Paenibacillus darwinianus]EXX89609.1 spore gernimation protein [Paenibacillus darwinianus]EXX90252.1 spore gernimation protein [Paenibacillus darwinianus]